MKQLEQKLRGVLILFFMAILFGVLGQTSSAAEQPEFVATQIHQASTPVYGLAWGDFDPCNVGMEATFIASDGSVFELLPNVPDWQLTKIYQGVSSINWLHRETLSIGDVHSGYAGNEVISCAGTYPTLINVIFHDPAAGWSNEVVFDSTGLIGQSWGAYVGDYDPCHPGDEIFHIYEGAMDFSTGILYSEVAGVWGNEGIYAAEVGYGSAAGEFNPDHPGPEIVVVSEARPAYEILMPERTQRIIWFGLDDSALVVEIADVDPCYPGNELIYGTAFNNRIMMSRHNGANPHYLEVLFTGNATEYGRTAMLDIAIGDILPQEAGLEILGVDHTGSVYLVRRVDGVWQGQVIWQDSDSLHAVIAGDFLPARSGDEILVAGESGAITLLSLTFTDSLTGDGKVYLKDFAELANYWQQSESSADISPWPIGDGIINILDLSVLADAWLQTAYWVE
jgi:hypothetical protein